MSQLPADCLNDIFEYLKEDEVTLHSCLLVTAFGVRFLLEFYGQVLGIIDYSNRLSSKRVERNFVILKLLLYASFCELIKLMLGLNSFLKLNNIFRISV